MYSGCRQHSRSDGLPSGNIGDSSRCLHSGAAFLISHLGPRTIERHEHRRVNARLHFAMASQHLEADEDYPLRDLHQRSLRGL